MKYAARGIQLAENLGHWSLEAKFLAELKNAKSNIPQFQDGAKIYQKFVKPSVVTFAQVVNHYAIHFLFKPTDKKKFITLLKTR